VEDRSLIDRLRIEAKPDCEGEWLIKSVTVLGCFDLNKKG